MMSEPTGFLREILSDQSIPAAKLAFFRTRLVDRLFNLIAAELRRQGIGHDKASVQQLGRRIGRDPFEMESLLHDPAKWDLDIASDLVVALFRSEIGIELLPLTDK